MVEVFWTIPAVTAVVAAGVAAIRSWALHRRILDVPNERSSHTVPTPRGGGLMIVAATIIAVGWLAQRSGEWSFRQTAAFLGAGLLVAVVSWIDDLRSLSNRLRLSTHLAAALIVILGAEASLSFGFAIAWPLAAFLTLIWIAGLTNAYNFMDGIDGIAGLQGVIGGGAWAFLAWRGGDATAAAAGAVVAAACLGFLLHNWPPARIFMGDVGSAFLGFTFASLPLLASRTNDALTAVLIVWPFVFDTAFTFLRRLRRGEQVFSAHRSHLYQRLVIAGRSHRFVTVLYGSLALAGGIFAALREPSDLTRDLAISCAVAVLALSLWGYVVRSETSSRPFTSA